MRALAALTAVAALALGGFTANANAQTITEIVAESGGEFDNNKFDYDILLTAVVTADLAGALANPKAELTVFAPNDAAFILLARDLGYDGRDEAGAWNFLVAALTELGEGDPIPVLTAVLLYHVAPGDITAFDFILLSLFQAPVETLLEGATFQPQFFRIVDNDPDLRNASLFFPLNVAADNGRIHTITRVLIPIDL
jgi:uncharacterized surface protein with fasciclin (FAS1) repeats